MEFPSPKALGQLLPVQADSHQLCFCKDDTEEREKKSASKNTRLYVSRVFGIFISSVWQFDSQELPERNHLSAEEAVSSKKDRRKEHKLPQDTEGTRRGQQATPGGNVQPLHRCS